MLTINVHEVTAVTAKAVSSAGYDGKSFTWLDLQIQADKPLTFTLFMPEELSIALANAINGIVVEEKKEAEIVPFTPARMAALVASEA